MAAVCVTGGKAVIHSGCGIQLFPDVYQHLLLTNSCFVTNLVLQNIFLYAYLPLSLCSALWIGQLAKSYVLSIGYSLYSKIPPIIVYYLPYKRRPAGGAFGHLTREAKTTLYTQTPYPKKPQASSGSQHMNDSKADSGFFFLVGCALSAQNFPYVGVALPRVGPETGGMLMTVK